MLYTMFFGGRGKNELGLYQQCVVEMIDCLTDFVLFPYIFCYRRQQFGHRRYHHHILNSNKVVAATQHCTTFNIKSRKKR